MNRLHALLLTGISAVVVLVIMLAAPENLRLRYASYAALIPMGIGVIVLRPHIGLILLMLVGGLWGPKVNLRSVNVMLYQLLILMAAMGTMIQVHLLKSERRELDPTRAGQLSGFPLIAVGPALSLLVSFPFTENNAQAFKITLWLGVMFCAYYTAFHALCSWDRVKSLLKAFFAGAVLVSLFSLIYGRKLFGHAGTPALDNPNALGCFVVLPTVFFCALIIYKVRLFQSHLLEVAGVATMMTAVLHSASRSALLGLMCGLAAAFILARKVRLSILLSLGTLLALAIFFVDLTAVEDKLGTGGASGIEYRLQKIEMAMEMFYASPVFGKGPGSFTTAAKNSGVRAIMEHTTLESTYPYILAEFGLFGLLCWSASLLLCYRRWRMLPRDKNDIRKVIGNAIIGGIICLLAVQIGENTLFFPKTNWIIGCMLGLLASLRFLPAWHRGGLPAGLAGESSNRTGNIDRPAPDVF